MTTNHEELICTNCGCSIENGDEHEYDGEYYCSDCFYDEFAVCEECGEAVPMDLIVSIDDGRMYVCEDCAENYYEKCDGCGNYYSSRHIWASDGSRAICDECSDYYYVCEECGDIVHMNYVIWYRDNPYCSEDCLPNGYIHEYEYKPNWQEFRTVADAPKCRTYGVEVEIDDGNNAEECAEALNDANEYIIMKEDGSLSSNGIEIVTHPSSLAFHMNAMGWDESS